jgi:hypothetical protein
MICVCVRGGTAAGEDGRMICYVGHVSLIPYTVFELMLGLSAGSLVTLATTVTDVQEELEVLRGKSRELLEDKDRWVGWLESRGDECEEQRIRGLGQRFCDLVTTSSLRCMSLPGSAADWQVIMQCGMCVARCCFPVGQQLLLLSLLAPPAGKLTPSRQHSEPPALANPSAAAPPSAPHSLLVPAMLASAV